MDNSTKFTASGLTLSVTAYSDRVLRITYGERMDESVIVTGHPQPTACVQGETEGASVLQTPAVSAEIDKDTLDIRFYAENNPLLEMTAPEFMPYEIYRHTGGENRERKTVDGVKTAAVGGEQVFDRVSRHAKLTFSFADDVLFGLGSHEEGWPCINGQFVPLYQENMRIAVPTFISTKGWAVLIDNTSFMTFDCREKRTAALYIDCADCVDLYFIAGDPDEIYAAYRFLTGETPLPPKASLGYFQSKCEYNNQSELIDVVKRYRALGVPLDFIVQDWQYWRDGMWGDKHLDPARFPDMSACVDILHEMGAKVMISVWPNVGGDSPDRRELTEKGCLLGDGSVYNAFDEKGRAVYWAQAQNGLFRHGIDAWWCDCTEPYEVGWGGETREPLETRMAKTVSEYKKYVDDSILNAYSLFHSKGIYENQRRVSDKRVLNMSRSGYAGQHRYGTIVWSGDISASWNTLKKQIHILQNYIATGEAYWNADVGGFFHDRKKQWFWQGEFDGGTQDSAYRELYVRWLQFAGFTPVMRSHGMGIGKEIWRFGAPGEMYFEAIKASIELRYRLLPFFYSVHAAVTFTGKMPVKPLALAFPQDERACSAFGQYLYGDTLLVCPVTDPGVQTVCVYLPEGLWYDFYTNEKYVGGKEYDIPVSLFRIPVFARAGAIVSTAPVTQYTDERPDAEYTVLIYPGADGEFELYDDAGNGYGYEKGEFCLTRIMYTDTDKSIRTEQTGEQRFAHKTRFVIVK